MSKDAQKRCERKVELKTEMGDFEVFWTCLTKIVYEIEALSYSTNGNSSRYFPSKHLYSLPLHFLLDFTPVLPRHTHMPTPPSVALSNHHQREICL